MLEKIDKIFFSCARPPSPPELHMKIFFFQILVPRYMEFFFSSNPCTRGYMIFYFFFKSMYPGTWNFDFSSNPCTGVHEILISFTILMCSSGGGGPGFYFFLIFGIFFQHVKKLLKSSLTLPCIPSWNSLLSIQYGLKKFRTNETSLNADLVYFK